MINIAKYENILNQGLLLDHYFTLCTIRDGGQLPKSKRVQGFINLLHKKKYLSEGSLTDIAKTLIDNEAVVTTTTSIVPNTTKGLLKTSIPTQDYLDWANKLHGKLQDKLFEKTGKRQARGTVQGTSYSFLPNATDFSKVLLKVIVLHKIKNFDKVEKCLMRFVEKRIEENYFFPLVGYYIMKNNMSTMITDMESMEENDKDISSSDSSINI